MIWYVDFNTALPCAEEMMEECIKLEGEPEKESVLKRYRTGGRVEFTWGWFLEKTALYRKRDENLPCSKAEKMIFALIDKAWRKHPETVRGELLPGARQFWEMLEKQQPEESKESEMIGRLYQCCPVFWSVLADMPETKLAEKLAKGYCRELQHRCQYDMQKMRHLRDCGEMCRRMAQKGENLFLILYQKRFFEGDMELEILSEFWKLLGGSGEIDLADLEEYVEQGNYHWIENQTGGQPQLSRGVRIPRLADWNAGEAIVWAAKNLCVTNRTKKDFFVVQIQLVFLSTEDELVLMREKGAFPQETLRRLVHEARWCGETGKLPLLIQWMYEGGI